MAEPNAGGTLGLFERMIREGTVAGLTDAQLLERYVVRKDASSFEALVTRYGPMVLGVCRRRLRDGHAAEDAFQATFLVLVRKAGSIRVEQTLGPWIHGVATKVAERARADQAKRQAREGPGDAIALAVAAPDLEAKRRELGEFLDDELERLPEKYREPVVLCHLEGLTHEEAAQRLGCPKGTVSIRLMRAHARLRDRLTRRGATPTALTLFARGLPSPSVPPRLFEGTIRAATGPGTIGSTSLILAQGVLRTMIRSQFRNVAVALTSMGLVASIATWSLALAARPVPPRPRQAVARVVDEPKPAKLVKGRVIDDQGKPVPNAEVWQPFGDKRDEVLRLAVDAEGRFSIPIREEWLRPTTDVDWWLGNAWAVAPGHSLGISNNRKAIWGPRPLEVTIKLGATTDTSFVVLDPDGKPVVGAKVQPYEITDQATYNGLNPPEKMQPRLGGVTDEDGRVRLPSLDRAILERVAVTTREWGRTVFNLRDDKGKHLPILKLPPVGRVEGRIISEQPGGARGITLYVSVESDRDAAGNLDFPEKIRGEAEVVTDDRGRFVIPAIVVGDLSFAAEFDRKQPYRIRWPENLKVAKGEVTHVDLAMYAGVKVRGVVWARGTHKPLADGQLWLNYGEKVKQYERCVTGPDGRFEGYALPGPVKVFVFQPPEGYGHTNVGPAWTSAVVVPGDVEEFQIPPVELIKDGPPIAGTLIDAQGKPLPSVAVLACDGDRCHDQATTEDDGTFQLTIPEDAVITQYQARASGGGLVPLEVAGKAPLVLKAANWK